MQYQAQTTMRKKRKKKGDVEIEEEGSFRNCSNLMEDLLPHECKKERDGKKLKREGDYVKNENRKRLNKI